ncbi:MAG: class I SAM-dependent methyltransferase [Candidatus Electryonea clarkiae]|nr:class I SAM-dependent methyltransferase [Candidatus Electryonea clarkiae]MDP8285923.1 class I SAM-dependent methyltransferase [Candidatus Electryonea clarkiae]
MSGYSKVKDYYRDQRLLFDDVAEGNGLYNLGWAEPGFKGQFADAQRGMVLLVTKSLQIQPGSLLVDIGCGQGGPARLTAEKYDAEVIGIDLLIEQITHHNQIVQNGNKRSTQFIQSNSEQIPLGDRSVDGVFSIESAFHYPDKAAFVSEASRILRPGARLAVADIVMDEGYENHWVHSGFRRALAAPVLFTCSDYKKAAIKAGLKPLHSYDLTAGVMRSLRLAAKRLGPRIPLLTRAGYPLPFLLIVQSAFLHLQYTHPLIPAKYRLFVFQKL